MASGLHVGVEGGGSVSKGILLSNTGEVLSKAETGPTNHWQLGFDATAQTLLDLIDDLIAKANLQGCNITSAGFSLSGADSPQCAKSIADTLYKLRPGLITGDDNKARVYNDSKAALETATDQGGEFVYLIFLIKVIYGN
jgi:N-acetylglucosamine kinase-like BadF-type ATPase